MVITFTLGTALDVCGPGGVTSGLVLWLKANNGPDASIDGSNVE